MRRSAADGDGAARRATIGPHLVELVLPITFVVLWSTGFVVSKVGVQSAGPFTFLFVRFALTSLMLAGVTTIAHAPWPTRKQTPRFAVSGILLQGGYLGGVFAALSYGVEAGAVALIVGLQPVVTAVLAGPFLGERITGRQWIGLGLGLAGVALVVFSKLKVGLGTIEGMGLALVAMLSITAGTLWQKRFGGGMDLRSGTCVQNLAACAIMLPLAAHEGFAITLTPSLVLSMAWLCIALSTISTVALFVLIERGAAARVASLFFLVPPTTAIIAWIAFGEALEPVSFAGMALTVVAVALVTVAPRSPAPP